ncbi:MAG: FAD binding domain-containing protein [Deltaproteobacteria bacterium]|nr:FAD binding domain-containing protein [Deltaproteobacteria bacterium]
MSAAFHYLAPRSVGEALEALAGEREGRVLAGGTDLIVAVRAGKVAPSAVVDVTGIGELQELRAEADGTLRIGAAVSHARVAMDPLVRRYAPVLARASAVVGSVQVRNLGTLGGNVVNASVAADTLPALAALEARFEVAGAHGRRVCSVDEFFLRPGRTALGPAELLVAVLVPKQPEHGYAFLKVGRRRAVAISRLSVAVLANGAEGFARVSVGAVFPRPGRLRAAEEALRRDLGDASFDAAGRAAEAEVRAVSGARASMAYKLPVVRSLVARAAREAFGAAGS